MLARKNGISVSYRILFSVSATRVFAFDSLTHRSIAIFLTRNERLLSRQRRCFKKNETAFAKISPLLQSSLSLFSKDNIEIILLSSAVACFYHSTVTFLSGKNKKIFLLFNRRNESPSILGQCFRIQRFLKSIEIT